MQKKPRLSSVGKDAEKSCIDIIAKELNATVTRKDHIPASMDAHVLASACTTRGRIGVEVKSMTSTVSTDEIAKFLRDVAINDFRNVICIYKKPYRTSSRGIHLERVATQRGFTWCCFVSPIQNFDQQLAACAAVTMALAQERLSFRNSGAPGIDEVISSIQDEIQVLSIKRKLREEESRFNLALGSIWNIITACQQRFSTSTRQTISQFESSQSLSKTAANL